MLESSKQSPLRVELRGKIIGVAVRAFMANGIKSITMDDIAASLGISKRTLYEVFANKETLLEECILHEQQATEAYVRDVISSSNNALEVMLKLYLRSLEKFHATSKKFFEDIKKYPHAYELLKNDNKRNSVEAANFFQKGVEQGIFRSDVNFAIVNLLLDEQLNLLLHSDRCASYSFLEVYESIMFTYLRGISTQRGAEELERFIRDYRARQTAS